MKFRVAVLIVLFGCWSFSFAANSGTVAPNGETTISAGLGKKRVSLSIRTFRLQGMSLETARQRFVQCTGGRVPCSLTPKIQVRVNGVELSLPSAAYADLGDINSAAIEEKGDQIVITLDGGDASESYIAKLIFDKDRLVERRIYPGEDATEPVEISHYYIVTTSD